MAIKVIAQRRKAKQNPGKKFVGHLGGNEKSPRLRGSSFIHTISIYATSILTIPITDLCDIDLAGEFYFLFNELRKLYGEYAILHLCRNLFLLHIIRQDQSLLEL